MINDQEQPVYEVRPQPERKWPVILAVLAFLGLGGIATSQYVKVSSLQDDLKASRQEIADLRSGQAAISSKMDKSLTDIETAVAASRKDTTAALQRTQSVAQNSAKKHADAIAQQFSMQMKKQQEENQAFSTELSKVKESAEAESNKLTGVASDVGNVRTELASTKSDVEKTFSDLQRMRGDMGVMSGLVATNSKEITALRELGDRNIYEFTLTKEAKTQRVGDVQLALNKADVKRNRYTMTVGVDDRSIQKKDKTVNEPVQFYVPSKARLPYEIVVNEVTKNSIKGYLSTPKVTLAAKQ